MTGYLVELELPVSVSRDPTAFLFVLYFLCFFGHQHRHHHHHHQSGAQWGIQNHTQSKMIKIIIKMGKDKIKVETHSHNYIEYMKR